jgi:hypothetical protein
MNTSSTVRKILVLAANPRTTERLRLEEEEREIDEGLRRSRHRDQFELISKWAVRERDFYRHMLDVQPHIVHFSGHGTGEAGIVLEDETGRVELLPTEQLAGLFKLFAEAGLECVLLNACYSDVQAEAIHKHVPYVIGMSQAIGDQAAINFAIAFYDALGAGRTVEFAYELGCVELMRLKASGIPVLLKNQDAASKKQSADELTRHNNSPSVVSINSQVPSAASPDFEPTRRVQQEMATDIEAAGDIEAGDMAQKAREAAVVEQVMVKDVAAENIKLGNLTQEG